MRKTDRQTAVKTSLAAAIGVGKGLMSIDERAYHTVAQCYSYGEWQNCGYQNSEPPEPIVTKFGTGDYVGGVIPQAKIQSDRLSAASRQMGEILLSRGF